MKSKCLDPVTIQAFLDGELPVLEMEAAAAHTASCPSCGEIARELEAEIFAIGQAFEPELTLPVPTAQLRARVNAAIAELSADSFAGLAGSSLVDRLRNWVAGLTPQAAFGLASAAVVMALIAWVAVSFVRSRNANAEAIVAAINLTDGAGLLDWSPSAPPPLVISDAPRPLRPVVRSGGSAPKFDPTTPLPGETTYMDTIAQLNHSLAERDDLEVRPTLRADVERNLAVLDQAIATSQEQARLHPKDPNAVAFLYSAYQNKVEFLRTVSDQAQLYAALR